MPAGTSPVPHARQGRDADMPARTVGHRVVHLVREEEEVVLLNEGRDLLQLLLRVYLIEKLNRKGKKNTGQLLGLLLRHSISFK